MIIYFIAKLSKTTPYTIHIRDLMLFSAFEYLAIIEYIKKIDRFFF